MTTAQTTVLKKRPLLASLTFAALLWTGAAQAECVGTDLITAMPEAEQTRLRDLAAEHPFSTGNYFLATKGDQSVVLVGTYHLEDPRHAGTVEALVPLIEGAEALLVEAGPEEERALKDHIGRDPSVMMITEGPTLLQRLPPETWERLSTALEERGIPGFMAAKFQPWYATMMLGIPPCAMAEMVEPEGLDRLLMVEAVELGKPVVALEPYDTLFSLFGQMTAEEEIAMIDATLATEDQAEDYSTTLVEAYFRGESRLIWEMMREEAYDLPGYTRARVDEEFAMMERLLMDDRNRAWIPVIEAEAEKGPLVVAFGALHLPGKAGVPNLLAEAGWTVEPLELVAP